MAAGDSTLTAGMTAAQYRTLSSKVNKEFFNAELVLAQAGENILQHLQGGPGSGKPFTIKSDLSKGAGDTVNFVVGAALGAAARRGTERAVNFEEQLRHNTWSVSVDTVRHVVSWNNIVKVVSSTGEDWDSLYAREIGSLVGRTEREDMLMKFRQRSSTANTIRPGNRATLDAIQYDDTLDAATLGKAISLATTNGVAPASLGKNSGGLDLRSYVALGPNLAFEGLWQDPTFMNALLHAEVDGPSNPFFSGKLPMWRNTLLKPWDIVNHDTPGSIGSSLIPQATLGDAITTATTAFTMYGGGVSQSDLGDNATLYKPFELFYGCNKRFGLSLSMGADAGTYYFVVIDPADGLWNLYSYVGSNIGSNGHNILITARLGPSSDSGVRYTTVKTDGFGGGGSTLWTYDTTYNKTAFPTGSIILQVNVRVVPVCDTIVFGKEVGAKCYGAVRNREIEQEDDYKALSGIGQWSIYGNDIRKDSNGSYHRNFVRIQSAYEHPMGALLPSI